LKPANSRRQKNVEVIKSVRDFCRDFGQGVGDEVSFTDFII